MGKQGNKHKNYEILNLIGYGLSKFDKDFTQEFGFTTKTSFYQYCVDLGICETTNIVKIYLQDNFSAKDIFIPLSPFQELPKHKRFDTDE